MPGPEKTSRRKTKVTASDPFERVGDERSDEHSDRQVDQGRDVHPELASSFRNMLPICVLIVFLLGNSSPAISPFFSRSTIRLAI